MSDLLSVDGLDVAFGASSVVRDVSFQVEAGECLAVVGESGSGKSVTMRALLGLSGGAVRARTMRLGDRDLTRLSARAWRRVRGGEIGLVLQDALSSLDPLRPVGREIEEPLILHTSLDAEARRKRVRQVLDEVGMPEPALRARQRPSELSGGLRQRALIAAALAARPRVLIADEPTTALDVTSQARILGLLRELRDAGTAILLVSHDLAVVRSIADRVIVMANGALVESGPTEQIFERPATATTRSLLDAIPASVPRGIPLLGGSPTPAPKLAPAAELLSARSLDVVFHSRGIARVAVDDVSVALRPGATVGLVGESGSGKSTLARALLGLQRPDDGEVRFDGRPWSTATERDRRRSRHRLALVQQDSTGSFDPRWTVGRTIADALLSRMPRAERSRRVAELLAEVRLDPDFASRHPSQLSGGQRQRVAIARALATRPEIIVLDEPVSALDATVQAHILDLFDRLQRERGLGYLLISHDLGVVRHMSDELLVMRDGRIVERGATEALVRAPAHPHTRALIADTPGWATTRPSS